jgi:ribosomal protein S12 methylthiotransferase accessory factor YcaO
VLRDHGVPQVAAVNLQRADIGIPVVKVVVPGLEPVRTPWWRPGPRARHAMGATTTAASAAAVASQADRRHTQEVNA